MLTTHVYCIGEEVAAVCNQDDKAAFDFRVSPHVGEFEHQARSQPDCQTDDQRPEKDTQEDADTFKEAQDR